MARKLHLKIQRFVKSAVRNLFRKVVLRNIVPVHILQHANSVVRIYHIHAHHVRNQDFVLKCAENRGSVRII